MTLLLLVFIFNGLIITGAIAYNFWRIQQKTKIQLAPNCLITRHPVIFLNGRPSLFHFLKYWNDIPEYVYEHGYQTFEIPYSSLKKSSLKQQLINIQRISSEIKGFHLITDEALFKQLKLSQEIDIASVVSCTILSNTPKAARLSSIDLFPSKLKFLYIIPKISLITWLRRLPAFAHHCYTSSIGTWSPAHIPKNNSLPAKKIKSQLLVHIISLAESDLQCFH